MSTQTTLARNLSKRQLGGVIFGCTASTMKECLDKNLFGLPAKHIEYVRNVDEGMSLFLFNYDDRTLHGIYKAECRGQLNIDMHAWAEEGEIRTRYPAQVRVNLYQKCDPLSEVHFKPIIIDNYYSHCHFWFELDNTQTRKLISRFSTSTSRPLPSVPRSLPNFKWSDILTGKGNGEGSTSPHREEEFVDPSPSTSRPLPPVPRSLPNLKWSDIFTGKGNGEGSTSLHPEDEFVDPSPSTSRALPPVPRSLPNLKWSDILTGKGNGEGFTSLHPKEEFVDPWLSDGTSVTSDTSPCQDVDNKEMDAFGDEDQGHVIVEDLIPSHDFSELKIKGKEVEAASTDDSSWDWETREDNMMKLEKKDGGDSRDRFDCDYPAILAKLRNEMEELKIFKQEQTIKIGSLEKSLAEMKDRCQKLENRCLRLESISIKSTIIYGDQQSIELLYENDWKINESILILGGYDNVSWSSTLDLFSPSRDSLKSLKPMSCVRSFASAVKFEEELYVCGGGNSSTTYETVESYNFVRDEWTSRPSMNKKNGCLGCGVLNGKLFAVGGGNFARCYSDVEMYDPNLGKWICSRSMRQKRFGLGVAELNGAIYAIGGYDGSDYLKTVERFDPREHDWSRIENMEQKRGGASLVALKEKLYAIGGYDGTKMVSSVEVYEPRVGKWTSIEAMNQQRGYMAAAVLDDCIYAIGGAISSVEVLDTIECYREGGRGWETKSLKAVGKRGFASAIVLQ